MSAEIIKVKIYGTNKEYVGTYYSLRNNNRWLLDTGGGVFFQTSNKFEALDYHLLDVPYGNNNYDLDIIEINGKFGVYDYNMNLRGKLYDTLKEVEVD